MNCYNGNVSHLCLKRVDDNYTLSLQSKSKSDYCKCKQVSSDD